MLLKRQSSVYVRDLLPLSLLDAEGEPETDRLFAELPVAQSTPTTHPRITFETMVQFEGYTFTARFNDVSLGEAANILRRRGCIPATPVTPAAPAPAGPAVATVEPAPVVPEAVEPDLLAPRTMPRGLSAYERYEYYGQLYEARRIRGKWLKAECKAQKLPHKELAARVGVSAGRITAFVTGDACDAAIWRRIETVLGRRYEPTK